MARTNGTPSTTQSPVSGAATLQLLGGFELRDKTGQAIELKARKSRLLLAYLAVPTGQVRTRDQLATLLWSNRQDEQARGSLRTALSGIRNALGEDALIVEQDTVRLRPGHLTTDYDTIQLISSNAYAAKKLDEFYTGPFLAGYEYDDEHYMDWLRGRRTECAELAILVLETSANRLTDKGKYQPAISLMRECLALEPLKEQTHRTIMQLYAASGERAMAMAQYRTCKELLKHELDTVPAPETQSLADSIALQNPEASGELHRQATSLRQISIPAHNSHRPKSAPAETKNASIAVLPFVNMSGDAEQNYFADGITEDIITDLSSLSALSVAAKSASQMYRGATVAPVQISAELGVRYILEGSVRKAGDQVRISAHLTDAHTNRQEWSERYDRRLENIFDLQTEISTAIVGALRLTFVSGHASVTEKRTTANVEAYQYYLRGQVAQQYRSKRSLQLAHDLYKQAVAIDPNYALAYCGIATCAAALHLHYDVAGELLAEALEHCDTALRLQPDLAEAYAARGHARIFAKNFDLVKEDLEKALELSPDLAEAHFHMGHLHLNTVGGVEQAYFSYKRAFELSSDISDGMMLATCLRGMENWDEMRTLNEKLLKISQRKFSLDPHDAKAAYIIAISLNDLGKPEEAKHWASVAAAFDSEDGAMVYNLACLNANMGLIDDALAGVETTLKLGCNELKVRWMKYRDPDLEPLRADPRFDELLAKYGYKFRSRKPKR